MSNFGVGLRWPYVNHELEASVTTNIPEPFPRAFSAEGRAASNPWMSIIADIQSFARGEPALPIAEKVPLTDEEAQKFWDDHNAAQDAYYEALDKADALNETEVNES